MKATATDATPAVRAHAAAAALGQEALADWCAAVITDAVDPVSTPDPDPRWLAARAWTSWGDPASWRERGFHYWFRVWAARTLLHEWHPVAESAIRSGLRDPQWRVREMCAKVAARHELATSADDCARLAETDDVARVRVAALRALTATGEYEHGRPVMMCLTDPDRSVAAAAERTRSAMEARLDRTVSTHDETSSDAGLDASTASPRATARRPANSGARRSPMVCDHPMAIDMSTPDLEKLNEAADALRAWQQDDVFQLHPGDLGWFWRFGAESTAAAVRLWRREATIVAVGLLDGPGLLRLGIAPDAQQDEEVARCLATDLSRVDPGLLGLGEAALEAPAGAKICDVLIASGWSLDEPWTPLRRDLSSPVEDPGVRVESVGPEHIAVRAAVQRAAFEGSTFSPARWGAMADGPLYGDARCLLAFDEAGAAVATATVWSAGAGKPGLIEPMGVHADHRGHGHGTAITRAAAATLRELGSSCAVVTTPSSNVGGVATYRAAGFQPITETRDLRRDGAR